MKTISYLYSASKKLSPKTGLLRNDNTIAIIDERWNEDNPQASSHAQKVIGEAVVTNVIWWWPSSSAFSEIHGVSEFGIMNILTEYGFNIGKNAQLVHNQVVSDKDILKDYMEIQISIDDEHYKKIVSKYGDIKVVE